MSLAILPLRVEKLYQQSHVVEASIENKLHGFSKQMNIPKRDWNPGCLSPGIQEECRIRRMERSEIACGNVQT